MNEKINRCVILRQTSGNATTTNEPCQISHADAGLGKKSLPAIEIRREIERDEGSVQIRI